MYNLVGNFKFYATGDERRIMTVKDIQALCKKGKRLPYYIIVESNEFFEYEIALENIHAPETTFDFQDYDVKLNNVTANNISVNGAHELNVNDSKINKLYLDGAHLVSLKNVAEMKEVHLGFVDGIKIDGAPDLVSLYADSLSRVKNSEITDTPLLVTSIDGKSKNVEVIKSTFQEGDSKLILKQGDYFVMQNFYGNSQTFLKSMDRSIDLYQNDIAKMQEELNERKWDMFKAKEQRAIVALMIGPTI